MNKEFLYLVFPGLKDFDPNQPRDESGKWSETGADASRNHGKKKIGRTFSKVPDLGNLGRYTLDMILPDEGRRDPVDFGSAESLEWGYGPYGLVFNVPGENVYETDTPDYPIERAFVPDVQNIIGAYYNEDDPDVDVESFRKMLDEWGLEHINIKPKKPSPRATGPTSSMDD